MVSNGLNAYICDLVLAKDKRLQSSEVLELNDVVVRYLLVGKINLLRLLGDCRILDGDE